MVSPITGIDVVLKYAAGTTSDLTDEAMNVVNGEFPGVPDYTVYEITDSAKRYLDRSVVPTFQKYNGSTWDPIPASDIAEIQYAGGRLILKEPLGPTDSVSVSTGKYFSNVQDIIFANVTKCTWKSNFVDITKFTDSAKIQYPTVDEWNATIDTFVVIDNGDFPQLQNLKDLATNPLIAIIYLKMTNDVRLEGYCFIESKDISIVPDDVIKESISLKGDGPLYLRLV